jgi:integrase
MSEIKTRGKYGSGNIRQRGKASWAIKFDIGLDPETGKRRTRTMTVKGTKTAAQKELTKQLNSVNEGTHVDATKMTTGEYLSMWLEDAAKDSVGNKTFEVYADIVEKHLIPGIGDHKLKVLSPLHLDQYYKKAEKTGRRDGKGGLSKRSVVHHHRVLFNALERAVKWQMIASNPAIKAEPPKPKKTKIEFLEKEDIPLLLKAAKETPMFTLVFLALNTGMRRGELLGLRWSDIDLDQGFLAVNQTLQFTRANGLEFKPPKTEAGERTITLSTLKPSPNVQDTPQPQ